MSLPSSMHVVSFTGIQGYHKAVTGIHSVTYSDVSFREPESRADQTRMMSIVTTGPATGYYVDIFRSRKERGGDKMHDYFYHNLGQTLTLTGTDGTDLNLHNNRLPDR